MKSKCDSCSFTFFKTKMNPYIPYFLEH
jgi:hypothetical protein